MCCPQAATDTAEQLRDRVVQELDKQAILVGHGLYHDLTALKLDYWPVIDTARLFTKNPRARTLSLATVYEGVVGQPLRQPGEPHSGRDDAMAALKVVHKAAKGEYFTMPGSATPRAPPQGSRTHGHKQGKAHGAGDVAPAASGGAPGPPAEGCAASPPKHAPEPPSSPDAAERHASTAHMRVEGESARTSEPASSPPASGKSAGRKRKRKAMQKQEES